MSIIGAAPTKALAILKSSVAAITPFAHIIGQLLSDAQHFLKTHNMLISNKHHIKLLYESYIQDL